MQFPSPSVRFKCPKCKSVIHEIVEEIPAYDSAADRQSDANGYAEMEANCRHCGEVIELQIEANAFGLEATLKDHDTAVTVLDDPVDYPQDEEEYQIYLARNTPLDPYKYYQYATYDLQHLIAENEDQPIKIKAFYRMILTQYFSAIEAYLSDRLIRLVLENPAALSALVLKNKDWEKEKISVLELANSSNSLTDWVIGRLRETVFHNFTKIDHHYIGATGIGIFPNKEVRNTLMKFLPIRHDCVHRYGRSHDGKEQTVTIESLVELSEAIDEVVNHVEENMNKIG